MSACAMSPEMIITGVNCVVLNVPNGHTPHWDLSGLVGGERKENVCLYQHVCCGLGVRARVIYFNNSDSLCKEYNYFYFNSAPPQLP